ncbi:hypothetical protein [Ralstonia wenshanensis]|uniref:hypothetical protein n=1 Tax=Ralstonia wenshanensis TaxID=2842456 RepID=UPI0039C75B85
MKLDSKHKLYGHTIAEHIRTVSDELVADAVGLWQIVPAGRYGFELNGTDLSEFVRRCVIALLESRAKPVVGGAGTESDWILQTQYGDSNEEIANAVVSEWLAAGAGDCDPGGLWLALPSQHVGKKQLATL